MADTFGPLSVLARGTRWDAATLLSQMGFSPGDDEEGPSPEDLERVRDLLALTCSIVDRLEVTRDKRVAVGFASRLFVDSGEDAAACRTTLAWHTHGSLPPNQLLDLGEVAAAFADARQRLVDGAGLANPFRDASSPHLSASRLRLFAAHRDDLLGAQVRLRIAKHLDGCGACRRARDDVAASDATRPLVAV